MHKYNIKVFGHGFQCYVMKISTDTYIKLLKNNLQSLIDNQAEPDMLFEEIYQLLGIKNYLDAEFLTKGIINDIDAQKPLYNVLVTDEFGRVVWESDKKYFFRDTDLEMKFFDSHYFMIQDYHTGNFFNYQVELDKPFHPDFLSCKITDLFDGELEIITDLKYDGVILKNKKFGETTSQGFTYMAK